MRERPFHQLDVFTAVALRGNPLAVVHEAEGLSETEMQAFANWTNLSESTFLLPPSDPSADYRVRIFTPQSEMPFAGHPTLGSCQAWLLAGGKPKRPDRVVQQCNVGLVELRRDGQRPSFAAPTCRVSQIANEELSAITRALGLAPEEVELCARLDIGTVWVALVLRDAERVLSLNPNHTALRSLPKVGVVGAHPAGAACQLELRAFAASQGIPEDPVTGSLNAGVAQWLLAEGRVPERYVAAQGACIGRAGRVYVQREDGVVWVGGDVTVCVQGVVKI